VSKQSTVSPRYVLGRRQRDGGGYGRELGGLILAHDLHYFAGLDLSEVVAYNVDLASNFLVTN